MSNAKQQTADGRISEGLLRQVGVRWPVGVDKLLDELVQRANQAGAKCNRRELTAALVVAAHETSGDQLREVLVRYRQAKVEDILPGTTDKAAAARRRSRG